MNGAASEVTTLRRDRNAHIVILLLLFFVHVQGLMYALKSDECKEMEAKLHQEQMESIFQRDMLQYLIQDKVDVAVDHGVIWQGQHCSVA